MNEVHTGGCACGKIRFRSESVPLNVAICHCQDCRKSIGAVFATYVDFAREAVVFESDAKTFQSSPGVERLFCDTCGSPIAHRGTGSPDEINIYIGAMDHPDAYAPTEECNKESALWA